MSDDVDRIVAGLRAGRLSFLVPAADALERLACERDEAMRRLSWLTGAVQRIAAPDRDRDVVTGELLDDADLAEVLVSEVRSLRRALATHAPEVKQEGEG